MAKYDDISRKAFNDDKLIVEIPLTLRKQTALRQVNRLLKKVYEGRDVDLHKTSTAKVKRVKSKIRMTAVEHLLEINGIRKRYPNDALVKIGERARIGLAINSRAKSDEIRDEASDSRRMTLAVSRYLGQARYLMDNAARGVFPWIKPLDLTESLKGTDE